jgi:hypothetical protein
MKPSEKFQITEISKHFLSLPVLFSKLHEAPDTQFKFMGPKIHG